MTVQPPTDRQAERANGGGELLGAYRLVEELVRGELGTLWRAYPREGRESDATPVVIKRLARAHARNPEYRAALEREAELCARLRPPLFVRALRFERAPEPFAVMECIEGHNLALLLANARLHDAESTRFAVPLLVDALKALDCLHKGENGAPSLVHQAPVARHILVGFDGHARLIDLTLAMGPATPRAPLCDHRLQAHEMAPEQVLAPTMVDARADIFVLGMTLWETLTSQRLFDGKTPLEAQRRMLSGAIGAPSDASRGVHRVFDRIARRALARPRAERYASAGEMAAELRDEAMRVGAWAEPEEIGSWVRSTLALSRSAPRTTPTVPREQVRSEASQTMMGIGGPTPAVLSIADAYRQTQSGSSRGSGRHLRSTAAPAAPVRREPSIPVGGDDDETSIHRGRSYVPRDSEAAMVEPPRQLSAPDLSQLGAADAGYDDASVQPRRLGGPSFGMIVLAVVGVAAAGLGAYVVRARQNAPEAPTTFSAAPTRSAVPDEAANPSAAWPLPAAPTEPEVARATEAQTAPGASAAAGANAPRAAVDSPSAPTPASPVPAASAPALAASPSKSASTRPTVAQKVVEPVVAAPAEAAAEPKRKPSAKVEPAPRWDVAPTLGGAAQPSWGQSEPAWSATGTAPTKRSEPREPAAAAPAKEPSAPKAASSTVDPDLPINPY